VDRVRAKALPDGGARRSVFLWVLLCPALTLEPKRSSRWLLSQVISDGHDQHCSPDPPPAEGAGSDKLARGRERTRALAFGKLLAVPRYLCCGGGLAAPGAQVIKR